jgi:hypothetical protein
MTKLLAVVLVLGVGLLIVFQAKGPQQPSSNGALGNCYSDAASYSTPTLCE